VISDYLEYGQWPVSFEGGSSSCPTMYVDSSALSYAFDPVAMDGQAIGDVTGVLNQIWSKWIIVLADDDGISSEFAEGATNRPTNGPRPPRPRNPDFE